MKQIDIKDFALFFSRTRNAAEAAIAAGISPLRARLEGVRLLSDRRTRRQLEAADKQRDKERFEVRAGLERLAYGRVNDAAALAFAEEITPHMLAEADLFNVSEIKRIKGGGVEIKFFDRQKALEKLEELDMRIKNDEKARNLVEAVYGSGGGEIVSDSPLECEHND